MRERERDRDRDRGTQRQTERKGERERQREKNVLHRGRTQPAKVPTSYLPLPAHPLSLVLFSPHRKKDSPIHSLFSASQTKLASHFSPSLLLLLLLSTAYVNARTLTQPPTHPHIETESVREINLNIVLVRHRPVPLGRRPGHTGGGGAVMLRPPSVGAAAQ